MFAFVGRSCPALSVLFVLVLAACQFGSGGGAFAEEGNPPAARATAAEVDAMAERFGQLILELEDMALPPQPVDGSERHQLRRQLDFLVRYLEASRWQDERVLVLERERETLEREQAGVYVGDREVYMRVQATFEQSVNRIDAEIARLRAQSSEQPDSSEPPSVVLPPRPAGASRSATLTPRDYGQPIRELEALVAPSGRVHPRTKEAFRRRLDPLIAFAEMPLSREEQLQGLKNRLGALEQFNRVEPVGGSHDLYESYRRAVQAEAMQLREQIRGLEAPE